MAQSFRVFWLTRKLHRLWTQFSVTLSRKCLSVAVMLVPWSVEQCVSLTGRSERITYFTSGRRIYDNRTQAYVWYMPLAGPFGNILWSLEPPLQPLALGQLSRGTSPHLGGHPPPIPLYFTVSCSFMGIGEETHIRWFEIQLYRTFLLPDSKWI